MFERNKCSAHHLKFLRPYKPEAFLEGRRDSPIWIVGLNPAAAPAWDDPRTIDELQGNFFKIAQSNPYFRDFSRVSEWLYSGLGKANGVAHTDLVKCSSKSWPPAVGGAHAIGDVISNCSPFLMQQMAQYKPRMIICNGRHVSEFMKTAVPPVEQPLAPRTSYQGTIDGTDIWVVLSGYIGRIDNYARSRLGKEIEHIAEKIGLKRPECFAAYRAD